MGYGRLVMITALLDTHAVIWLLHGDKRLSESALAVVNQAARQRKQVALSSMSLVEIAYLEEKQRVPAGTLQGVLKLLAAPSAMLAEIPVSQKIITALLQISRMEIPDMPDRVIAATALAAKVPLVSRDRKIQASQVQTVW